MNPHAIEVPDPFQTQADMTLAKTVGDTLFKHYPNHLWGVHVTQGIISVKNLGLSGQWGFVLHITKIISATDLDDKLMRAGGEILERYKLSREKMNADRVQDKLMALPTDFRGALAFDK